MQHSQNPPFIRDDPEFLRREQQTRALRFVINNDCVDIYARRGLVEYEKCYWLFTHHIYSSGLRDLCLLLVCGAKLHPFHVNSLKTSPCIPGLESIGITWCTTVSSSSNRISHRIDLVSWFNAACAQKISIDLPRISQFAVSSCAYRYKRPLIFFIRIGTLIVFKFKASLPSLAIHEIYIQI